MMLQISLLWRCGHSRAPSWSLFKEVFVLICGNGVIRKLLDSSSFRVCLSFRELPWTKLCSAWGGMGLADEWGGVIWALQTNAEHSEGQYSLQKFPSFWVRFCWTSRRWVAPYFWSHLIVSTDVDESKFLTPSSFSLYVSGYQMPHPWP